MEEFILSSKRNFMKRNLFKSEIESNVSSIFISESNSLFSVEGLARQIRSSKEILAFRTEIP